jgi:peptidoglycan/xylan/chitin deacetylase (PgdA/CDA1 family)
MYRHLCFKTIIIMVLLSSCIPLFSAHAHAQKTKEMPELTHHEIIFAQLQARKRIPQQVTYIRPEQKTVYLTFDDGPSRLTEQVLDILNKEGIVASFFALGNQAEKYPETIKRIVKEGHCLGNHSYNHKYHEIYTNFEGFWNQIKRSEQILEQLVGFKPQLIRAPGGTHLNFDAFYFHYLEQAGYVVHDWNVDSRDSTKIGVSKLEIIQSVKQTKPRHVMNVLFHDSAGHRNTIEALPEIIRYYKELGYKFAKLSPEVMPIQFPLVKPRWTRVLSLSDYVISIDKCTANRDEAILHHTLPTSITENTPHQRYSNHRPLRSIIERIGGTIVWDDHQRIARVHFGLFNFEYDVRQRTVRHYLLGKLIRDQPLQDMRIINGKIQVLVTDTMQLVGSDISKYDLLGLSWITYFKNKHTPYTVI